MEDDCNQLYHLLSLAETSCLLTCLKDMLEIRNPRTRNTPCPNPLSGINKMFRYLSIYTNEIRHGNQKFTIGKIKSTDSPSSLVISDADRLWMNCTGIKL